MNTRIARAAVAVLLGFGVFGVSAAFAQRVNTDVAPDTDFQKIKTFSIVIGTGWNNEISEKRVIDTVAAKLQTKGWTKSENGTADVEVVLHGATEQKHDLNTFYTGGYGGYGWGGFGMGTSTTTVSDYTVGTLVVDIFDTGSKALIFRGKAEDELAQASERNQRKLVNAVDKMFKKFPPPPPKPEKKP